MQYTKLINHKFGRILAVFFIFSLFIPAAVVRAFSIDSLDVELIGTNVQVSWYTSVAASGCVQFGLASVLEHEICAMVEPSNTHVLRLQNLQEKEVYKFRVYSKDLSGGLVTSFERTFKTGERADTILPEISHLNLLYVGAKVMIVSWQTNEDASSRVEYGFVRFSQPDETELTDSTGSNSRTQNHEVKLSRLSPGAFYRYRVVSEDKQGNKVYSSMQTFRTLLAESIDTNELSITNVRPVSAGEAGIGNTQVEISWSTSRAADSTVRYGTSPNRLSKKLTAEVKTNQRQVVLTDLEPGTTYYFKVYSRDILGKKAESPSSDGSFSFKTTGVKQQVKGASTDTTNSMFSRVAQPAVSISSSQQQVLGAFTYLYTPATALLKVTDSARVYAVLNGQKHWIRSIPILQSYGYRLADVDVTNRNYLAGLADLRLVKEAGRAEVYYLYLDQGLKILIPSPPIFNSYEANNWKNIATISRLDLDSFVNAQLVKASGDKAVYLLENSQRRLIKTSEAFGRFGFDWAKVVEINAQHLHSIPIGAPIE